MDERNQSPSDTQVLAAKGVQVRKYFRRWVRNAVNLPARVEIVLRNGKKFTSGTALIQDISLRGARLGKFVLKKQVLPARPFMIHLFFHSEKYEGVGAVARPLRFGPGPGFEIVVVFEDLWARTDESAGGVRRKKTVRRTVGEF